MLGSYQEEQRLAAKEQKDASFATIGTVHADGVTLIFDGESEETQKHYKVNCFAVFRPNDRVYIQKDSGTYVVLFPIGNPKTEFGADKLSKYGDVYLQVANGYLQFKSATGGWHTLSNY